MPNVKDLGRQEVSEDGNDFQQRPHQHSIQTP